MYKDSPHLTLQEKDLKDFLCTLGVQFPAYSQNLPDGYVISPLGALAALVFKSRDGKAVLLGYRLDEITYPLSILFLSGEDEALLGHSTLLLDSYSTGMHVLPRLQEAIKLFFSQDADATLGALEKSWVNVPLKGQMDCRILWQMKPTLQVAVDVFVQKMGNVPEIPLFPSVYSYNNPYLENTLEVGLFEIGFAKSALVLGAGAGLDAVCIALQHGIPVDATDINPVAITNTMVAARRCGVDNLVHAWVSDGFSEVGKKYDAIFFSAPLATQEAEPNDVNRYDREGRLLKSVLCGLPAHLNSGGRMYLMSRPDLSPYFPCNGLGSKVRRHFTAKSSVAIHEIWKTDG